MEADAIYTISRDLAIFKQGNLEAVVWTDNTWKKLIREAKDFCGTFSETNLLFLFSEDLRTPAALYLLFQTEGEWRAERRPCVAGDVVNFILRNRDTESYKPGKGHKRAVLMAFLALCVSACDISGYRELSDSMRSMIEETYSERWRTQLIHCLTKGAIGLLEIVPFAHLSEYGSYLKDECNSR